MLKPAEIVRPTPPATYAPVTAPVGVVSPIATGIGGLIGGALIGAGVMAARKMNSSEPTEPPPASNPDGNSGSAGTE